MLVGHSYGGALLTNVPADAGEIVALAFIAGYALNPGESCGDGSALVPGGSLAETLERAPPSDGGVDKYIAQDRFHRQIAEDVPERGRNARQGPRQTYLRAQAHQARLGVAFSRGLLDDAATKTARGAPR
jgi:pimeloyl-ACP methyl ester carboxylesterase